MISELAGLAGQALGFLGTKEANKYADKFIKLEKQYHKELNSDPSDHAKIDNLEQEIAVLTKATSQFLKDLKK